MEFAWGGGRGDDADESRHWSPCPRPPPPPQLHGDAALAPGDAALARRREELLWELDKARVHQDMILYELVQTERTMASRSAPAGRWPLPAPSPRTQDYWHSRPSSSVPPWEEGAPLRPMHAVAQHPPCGSGSPSARPPPVYPHVERSPSPVPWRRPVDDIVQQQESWSSGARAQPFDGSVELRPSLNKRAPAEEALLPAAANDGVKRARSASFGEEVAAGHQRADVGRERKADGEERYGVQPLLESRSQNSGQRKIAESANEGRIDEPVQPSCQYSLAGKENAAFDEQKRLQFTEHIPEHQWPANETKEQQESRSSGAIAQPMSGYVELRPSPSKWTLMEETLVPAATNANIGPMQQKAEESAMKSQIDKLMQPPYQYRQADQENAPDNKQMRIGFNESTPERTSSVLKRNLITAYQHDLEEHLADRLRQSNDHRNMAKKTEPLHRDDKENVAEKSRSQQGEKPSSSNDDVLWPAEKSRGPAAVLTLTCNMCQARCTSESDFHAHLRGRRHRENMEARRARSQRSPDRKDDGGDAGKKAEGRKSRYYCNLCGAYCSSEKIMDSHLGGRRHRKAVEGRR